MDWIDEVNDEMSKRREAYRESIESGEVEKRKKSHKQSNAGKIGGAKLISLGKNNATPEGRAKGFEKARKNGAPSRGGKKHVESGHLAKVRNPSKAGLAAAKSDNSINKQKFKCPSTKEYPEGRIISRNWLKRYCEANDLDINDCIRIN